MAHTTSWYLPGKVILHRVTGNMTADDLEDMNRTTMENKPSSGRFLHQLIDISEMTKAPSIGTLRQHSRASGADDGYIVIVGKINRMIEFTITSIAQVTNFRMLVAPTVEDAIRQLRNLDPSL